MPRTLPAAIIKKNSDKISIEIKKKDFEAFCNAVGLFKEDFLRQLRKSESDHKAGRVTKRKSLHELTERP